MDQRIKVHVGRSDGYFWNGYLIDRISDGVYEFEECKLGKKYLFVLDIKYVEEIKEERK